MRSFNSPMNSINQITRLADENLSDETLSDDSVLSLPTLHKPIVIFTHNTSVAAIEWPSHIISVMPENDSIALWGFFSFRNSAIGSPTHLHFFAGYKEPVTLELYNHDELGCWGKYENKSTDRSMHVHITFSDIGTVPGTIRLLNQIERCVRWVGAGPVE